jgi:hypothetical protein
LTGDAAEVRKTVEYLGAGEALRCLRQDIINLEKKQQTVKEGCHDLSLDAYNKFSELVNKEIKLRKVRIRYLKRRYWRLV